MYFKMIFGYLKLLHFSLASSVFNSSVLYCVHLICIITKNESLKNITTQFSMLLVFCKERNEKNVIGINENVYIYIKVFLLLYKYILKM